MKIIQVDNFGRDYQPEFDIATGIRDGRMADSMCEALNQKFSSKASCYFYRVVADDYVNASADPNEAPPIDSPKEVPGYIPIRKIPSTHSRRQEVALKFLPAIIGIADENRDIIDNVDFAFRIADAFLDHE
jgi:hypothetical protein